MSNTPQRLVRPSSRNLLSRVLDQPELPAQIQNLPPIVFGRLIDRIGLEDAGELVALATTEQLAQAFDEDLWKSQRPGEDEQFDADRFLVWLEVLLEAGDAFVASRVVEMPEDLVTLALHKCVLVLDIEALALDMQAADEVDARQLDKALESCLYEEINGFQVMARDSDGWDGILTLLLALDREHHEFLQRILERCCAMSSEYIEDNGGLYEVLTSEEMLEADVAGDREDRRAEAGHVAPSSASSFLKLARTGPATTQVAQEDRDPVTRAYFRNLRPASKGTPSQAKSSHALSATSQEAGGLPGILKEAGVLVETPARHLLAPAVKAGDPSESLLVDAMRALADEDPRAFTERSEELAYLTNVLVAACSLRQRRFRPIEAVRVAIATCNLGLCLALSERPSVPDAGSSKPVWMALRQFKADNLFRSGWHRLHEEVVDPAAKVARRIFERMASNADSEALVTCKRAVAVLDKACREGSPWQAISVLDGMLVSVDAGRVDTLRGLMDQCPTLPGAPGSSASDADRKDSGMQPLRYLSTSAALDQARRLLERLDEEPRVTVVVDVAAPQSGKAPRNPSRKRKGVKP